MATKAQIRAYQKYSDKTYDRLAIRVPKGEREMIAEYAAEKGFSMAEFIRRSYYAAMGIDWEKRRQSSHCRQNADK